jgi:Mitotic checkpoint regulator, MAD2B-interacting
MNLVAYSDSEGSENESVPTSHPQPSAKATSKQSFQKLIDRSKPHKIRVDLPSTENTESLTSENGRAAKRQRLNGGGTFAGLASFLPPPKHLSGARDGTSAKDKIDNGKGKSFTAGVSLKTGTTPAFARTSDEPTISQPTVATELDAAEVKLVGKATIFKPLSITKKKQKKKPLSATKSPPEGNVSRAEPPRPKVSLFSIGAESAQPKTSNEPEEIPSIDEVNDLQNEQEDHNNLIDGFAPVAAPQTLNSVVSDMQLDEAARRQLFGRKGEGDMQIKLVNFDTDQEYAANEALRAAGETVQHNPLRAIQPGKHSLRQLINAATSQKEALEESWAAGKRNQKESGTRYGW